MVYPGVARAWTLPVTQIARIMAKLRSKPIDANSIAATAHDLDFERHMAPVRKVMRTYRRALRELAK
jgi:hypothetical protein